MIKEIAQFVASKSGFTLGTTLQFGHREQDAPARCILVAFNAGGGTDFYLPDREDKMVQILARAESYVDAYEDAMIVYDAIHGTAGWTLTVITTGKEYEIIDIEAMNPPQYVGPDEKGRHEWSTNYIFRIKDATA